MSAFGVILVRFFPAFSRIWTEYREIRSISPYSVRMPENTENTDQKELRNWTFFTKWRLLRISLDKCYILLHEQFKLHFSVSMRKASYHCFFQRNFLPQKLSSVRNTIILDKSWKFDDLEKIWTLCGTATWKQKLTHFVNPVFKGYKMGTLTRYGFIEEFHGPKQW